jgi:hypothetical protein
MKIVRFPKTNAKLDFDFDFEFDPSDVPDEFSREIETIRANEPLMEVLISRAKQPATVSLEYVKQQIEIEED